MITAASLKPKQEKLSNKVKKNSTTHWYTSVIKTFLATFTLKLAQHSVYITLQRQTTCRRPKTNANLTHLLLKCGRCQGVQHRIQCRIDWQHEHRQPRVQRWRDVSTWHSQSIEWKFTNRTKHHPKNNVEASERDREIRTCHVSIRGEGAKKVFQFNISNAKKEEKNHNT